MKNCAMLIFVVAVATFALAQTTQQTMTSYSTAPGAQPVQTIVVPGTGVPGAVAGPSTNTGTAVIIAPPSAPLLVTPQVHLTTVIPGAGATNATAGNTAGAVNSTAALPVTPTIITTVPQYAGAAATVTVTPPPEESENAAQATFNAGVTGTATTAAPVLVVSNGAAPFNAGVGSSGVLLGGGSSGESLGEIAREYRQQESTQNAHVYTNQDIERLNQQPGTGGTAGLAVGAGKAVGTQPQPAGGSPAVSQPTTNPPASPGVSQPAPPK